MRRIQGFEEIIIYDRSATIPGFSSFYKGLFLRCPPKSIELPVSCFTLKVLLDLLDAGQHSTQGVSFSFEHVSVATKRLILDNVVSRGGRTDALKEEMLGPGFMREIATPEYLVNMVKELGKNNWTFTGRDFVTIHKGTRPGSPLAASLFHFTMTKINMTLMQAVANHQENTAPCEKAGIVSRQVLWTDDIAFARTGQRRHYTHSRTRNADCGEGLCGQGHGSELQETKDRGIVSFRRKDAG